jgi:hypothetical protein
MDITQGPNHVVIRNEMIHESRVIPLDGSARPGPEVRSYLGIPRGRWEGNVLVVETTNFTERTQIGVNGNGNPHSDALTVTERFIPVDGKTIHWEVTVNDPKTWTQPWTFLLPLKNDPSQIVVEYACHEGNYAVRNMLTGALAEEGRCKDTGCESRRIGRKLPPVSFHGSANEKSALPAAMATYCLPLTA